LVHKYILFEVFSETDLLRFINKENYLSTALSLNGFLISQESLPVGRLLLNSKRKEILGKGQYASSSGLCKMKECFIPKINLMTGLLTI
jgi:hypothetical protein